MSGPKIHTYLRAGGAGPEHEHVGPFLATFTPETGHPMRNYAIPDDNARPSQAEVDALVEVFAHRGLIARLEYADDAAPDLEAVLVESGFRVDARLAVLICRPLEEATMVLLPDFTVELAETDRDHLDAVIVANEAFGEPGRPDEGALAARRSLVAMGGAVALARDRATGEAAGSGQFGVPRAGISELAAVGTRVAFRNRGIAGAVCARLVHRAFAQGVDLLWLTPEHSQSERIYRRVGFRPIGGHMIHISSPPRT